MDFAIRIQGSNARDDQRLNEAVVTFCQDLQSQGYVVEHAGVHLSEYHSVVEMPDPRRAPAVVDMMEASAEGRQD